MRYNEQNPASFEPKFYFYQVTLATKPVHTMEFYKRRCLMHDEDLTRFKGVPKQLFHKYTRRNCILECLGTAVMHRCGCIPYFYPDFGEVWGHPNFTHIGHQASVKIFSKYPLLFLQDALEPFLFTNVVELVFQGLLLRTYELINNKQKLNYGFNSLTLPNIIS